MTTIIGLVQVKGGAGRSTLATNLAGELSKKGKTALIDADIPQGTSASWFAVRRDAGRAGNLTTDVARDHRELIAKVAKHQASDFIVLDGPPRLAEMTRAVLMLADKCLVPVGASVAEIWATGDVLEIIQEARRVREIDARIVWTRHRPHTNLARDLAAQAKAELGLPIMASTLGLRVAYPEALGTGLTVAEGTDAAAAAEIHALVAELVGVVQ